MKGQISAMNCINGWYPHKASPAEVKACAILHYIDGLIIAAFPPEKFSYINELKTHIYHGVSSDFAILFILIEYR